ncbi:aromatic ring-hydroxylating oxygenase subunit alpha [Halioxenophilus sp. WMMB6]|uniref:aromatic ring-hydroxylating oxygenase subunit alpha n=1 Tax=Halioxenophilus sp. WMMB6 TaxID=3073815 RepID=UPI00295E5511|nr:SRPBCC family protein [Halioxenophilus sp. WMMB6]
MQHDLQVRIIKALMQQSKEGNTHDAGRQCLQPAASYVDPVLAAQEWSQFFENQPQLIGLSGDLPEPNSFLTINDFGLPVLATRDHNGRLRAFVNACRHRGALVTNDRRGTRKHFSCPYHAWRYASDGALAAIPKEEQFGSIDKSGHGLVELPAVEKYGLLWVHPQVDGAIDPEQLLGGFAEEIASNELQRYLYHGEKTIDKRLNWKLANDTFGENYHFKVLHSRTLSQLYQGDNLHYEIRGQNHRLALARQSIDALSNVPETEWIISDGALVLYYLFPNIQLILGPGRISLVKIYPDGCNPGRSISRIHTYFTQEMLDQLDAARLAHEAELVTADNVYQSGSQHKPMLSAEAIMEVFNSTVENEDYVMGESQQQSAESGRLKTLIFGRNEAPLQHYHNTFRAALGLPPLETLD